MSANSPCEIFIQWQASSLRPKSLDKDCGVTPERTRREINGARCMEVEPQPTPKQQNFCSRFFSCKVTTVHELNKGMANDVDGFVGLLKSDNP